MRRLVLRLFLLIFTVAATSVGTAYATVQTAAAANPACNVASDNPDVVYQDWHNQTSVRVSDSFPGGPPFHDVGIDLWFWRVNHRPDPNVGFDHCYRAAYASEWTFDGAYANMTPRMRLWVCGRPTNGLGFARPVAWAPRADYYTDLSGWDQHLAGYQTSTLGFYVTLPSSSFVVVQFGDYGNYLVDNCLPQGDTYGMQANSDFWTPSTIASGPGGGWYCHDNGNGVVCP